MNPKLKTKTKSTPKLTKNNSSGNSSSRFLPCCRPQALDINMNDAVSVKKGVVLPRILPADAVAAAAAEAAPFLCGDDDGENISNKETNDLQSMRKMKKKRKNKGKHLRLFGILKAVFFETSVARKIRRRKHKQKTSPANGNENSMHKELLEVDNNNNGSIISNTLSASLCSSSAGFSPFSSKSSSDTNRSFRSATTTENKPKGNTVQVQKHHGKGCYGHNVGLCFIFISLLILIIWGKLCAIFCTSMWLFFGARLKIGNQASETVPVPVPVDSCRLDFEEYKKKIVMEGLLGRDHSRRL